jgi:hypothetical protein
VKIAYVSLAVNTVYFLLLQGTNVVRNDVGFASNDAPQAARLVMNSSSELVQTSDWIDYGCLRFYLRRGGWKGSVRVLGRAERFDAPWVFKPQAELSDPASGLLPEEYQYTSVKGLYRRLRFEKF